MINVLAVFQRAMNQLFEELIGKGIVIYLDDIIIYAQTQKELLELTKKVLQLLRKADFYCKPEKCFFNKQELDYLGFVVNQDGLKVDPYKIKAILEWPRPLTKRDIRKILGFFNFYKKFVEDYSGTVKPLSSLLSQKRTFTWGDTQEASFKAIKEAFAKVLVLVRPNYEKQFVVETDASDFAYLAILSQEQEDKELHSIAYYSSTFSKQERNYVAPDKELYAIIKALANWRHYLEGAKH
ncbi:DNA/RNA polymerase [Fomitiporia mediterranea MF3/22]|uniref:DNA/RNA polymerase n=1 Tax=Fomitiporia mediterranea (strain MF3/22) TaxID=694068 RepID=R7SG12_FOMME|nr:DNA/RNA polymerase [Fomitiporia mediterranea MF3/22]EJC97350.1 DNA/RNA polymerase [Fomitiporia mediterranea MF3/22]